MRIPFCSEIKVAQVTTYNIRRLLVKVKIGKAVQEKTYLNICRYKQTYIQKL